MWPSMAMNASDVMVNDVITVKPTATVQEAAQVLLTNRISGMPIVDDSGAVVGMITEGDLIRRADADVWPKAWGPPPRRGWLKLLMDGDICDTECVTQQGRTVADIMTREIISVDPDTSVSDIATLVMRHRIKRVPVMRKGRLVGLVSRANLLQALASRAGVLPLQSS
jgi:CBS domain-containing protein